METKNIRLFGVLGLIASIMVGASEFLLHFNPNDLKSDMSFGYFLGLDADRLTLGHYLTFILELGSDTSNTFCFR